MLTFDVTVSGGAVGTALGNDLEECGYALVELARMLGSQADEFVEYIDFAIENDHDRLALKALAGLILKGCE